MDLNKSTIVYEKTEAYIFEDEHRIIIHDDHKEIKCPVVADYFYVSSENGNLDIHCPGCGTGLNVTQPLK